MKFGIIGAGRIGKIHAGNVAARKDCAVAFVADADAGAATSLAQSTGACVGTIAISGHCRSSGPNARS